LKIDGFVIIVDVIDFPKLLKAKSGVIKIEADLLSENSR